MVRSRVPAYDVLAGVDPRVVAGLTAHHATAIADQEFEFAWQRDRALLEAVDTALADAASGKGEPGPTPRWLDGLVRRELAAGSLTFPSGERFVRIRLLERLGLVRLEPDDTYVLAMVSGLGPDKVSLLRADDDLRDRVLWRLFEVEGGGEVSLANVDRFGGDQWRRLFVTFAADGTLDRRRVLTACLRTLRKDFLAYRAAWFSATFLALDPTLDELAASQADLRPLLSAAVPATVGFSVKLLRRLEKAGRLELAETLAALGPATLVAAKGTALDALRLARAAGSEHDAAVIDVARVALGHPHADVQRTAAELLASRGDEGTVRALAEELAPSVRHDLGIGSSPVTGPGARPTQRPEQRLAPVPPPVTSADLAERVAALLEDTSDAGELEAVLAALARPGSESSLRPLRARARTVAARGGRTDTGESWLPGQVARLVLTLLDDRIPPADPALPALRFLTRRMAELRDFPGPLLATPDLPGGWVSPVALVERLVDSPTLRHHDVVAALLRLHPDGRAEVARAAGGELPPAVRFALDGAAPRRRIGRRGSGPAAWWVAAERSHAPYAESEAPRAAGEVRVQTYHERGSERRLRHVRFTITAAGPSSQGDDVPTELGSGRMTRSHRELGDWVPAAAAIWPRDAEHALALTCLPVLESPSWTETAHDVPRVLDALAQHPGRLGTLAAHTVAAGLAAGRREHRLHAVDAFLDLVPSCRIRTADLADALAAYWEAWPLTRVAESLRAAARDDRGPDAVIAVLTALLPLLPTEARGLTGLLDLLRDETLRCGRPVTDLELRSWLGRHSGSSKKSRTARLLLG